VKSGGPRRPGKGKSSRDAWKKRIAAPARGERCRRRPKKRSRREKKASSGISSLSDRKNQGNWAPVGPSESAIASKTSSKKGSGKAAYQRVRNRRRIKKKKTPKRINVTSSRQNQIKGGREDRKKAGVYCDRKSVHRAIEDHHGGQQKGGN